MHYINSTSQLNQFLHDIENQDRGGFITVDTEFHREDTYWSQLCLIQISGSSKSALIDPLADIDLSSLKSILFAKDIIKVFHSARQDLEIFYNMYGAIPEPIFDTQVAAMACGYGDSIGYANLVQQMLGQTIDKSQQVTNWKQRPLNNLQMQYALQDVTILRQVYEKLYATLHDLKRLDWIAEEIDSLCNIANYCGDPEHLWLSLKPRNKSSQYLAILQQLAIARDNIARTRNVPRTRVIKDQTLLEMASHPISCVADYKNLRLLPKDFLTSRDAEIFLQAIQTGKDLPISQRPHMPKRPSLTNNSHTVDLLKVYLNFICQQHQISPRLVACGEDLNDFCTNPNEDCPMLQGWRYEVFGKNAMQLINGEKALYLQDGKLQTSLRE